MESSVDLGFLEKSEAHLLTNRYFPSKVGGRPAWLDLEKIPDSTALKCDDCANELVFLCQVSYGYWPLSLHCVLNDFRLFIHRFTLRLMTTSTVSTERYSFSYARLRVAGVRTVQGKQFCSFCASSQNSNASFRLQQHQSIPLSIAAGECVLRFGAIKRRRASGRNPISGEAMLRVWLQRNVDL